MGRTSTPLIKGVWVVRAQAAPGENAENADLSLSTRLYTKHLLRLFLASKVFFLKVIFISKVIFKSARIIPSKTRFKITF